MCSLAPALALSLAVGLMAGCSQNGGETTAAPTTEKASSEAESTTEEESSEGTPAAEEEAARDTLTIATADEPPSMTTNQHNAIAGNYMNTMTHNGLFKTGDNMEPVPDLVESYENTSDTEWIFHLKQGVLFHNGEEMKAEDVKASLELCQNSLEVSQYAVPGTIEVVSREPQTINIEVARWVTQEVPVQLEQVGSLPDNYIVDQQNVTLDRQFITLSGPQSVVENIAMAKVTVDMTGRTESVEERVSVTLCDENGVPLDVSSVTVDTDKVLVKIPVLMVKDIQLQVSVISGGGLTAQDVTVTLDKTEITVSGSPAVISKLEDVLVLGTIDLSQELEGFTDRTYQVELPAGVKNLSGIEEVQVSLEMPEREIQSFDLSMEDMLDRVELQNVPDGVPVRVRENQQLTVWIRGQAKDLEKVMITDFRIVVDLTGATQTGMYEAQILVENVSGVGVVSDPDDPYEILVQIGESGQTTPAS